MHWVDSSKRQNDVENLILLSNVRSTFKRIHPLGKKPFIFPVIIFVLIGRFSSHFRFNNYVTLVAWSADYQAQKVVNGHHGFSSISPPQSSPTLLT